MSKFHHVHIVIADEGWILEKCARTIEKCLDYITVSKEPDTKADINYYVNYSAYRERCSEIEIAFFTHIEERSSEAAKRFFDVARSVDACVCMSSRYADELRQTGIQNVYVIIPGVDQEIYRPTVRIGVVGRTYHTGRKGEALVRQVMDEPGIEWHFTGEGWPGPVKMYKPEDMPRFYNSVDYILVPSYYEGGPMSVLEALACGKKVIAPPIGFIPDYPHIEYATGDAEDLRCVLRELVAERTSLRKSVFNRTWDGWARKHDELFREILSSRKIKSIVPGSSRNIAQPNRKLRVLLAMHSPENESKGGPSVRVRKTKEHLEKLGIAVDITTDDIPDAHGYNLAHVFNVWEPGAALAQLRHLKRFNIPVVFSPIYLDLSETAWAVRAIPAVFSQNHPREELKRYLAAIAEGKLAVDGISRFERNEIMPGYFAQLREMVDLSDYLIALSNFEMERLWAAGVRPRPFTLVRNAVDIKQFANVSGNLFTEKYGVRDYVLCVGRIEHRKNQLMLVEALRESDLPIVLIGNPAEPDYAKLVRRYSGPNVLFVNHLPHNEALLASAYAGARVFALPSWSEGAPLTALEAAAAGTALVLSNRSSESEYFGDLAVYCDPGDVESIRQAVLKAYDKHAQGDARRKALQEKVRTSYTWENTAHVTLQAYNYALQMFKSRPVRYKAIPRKLEIGSGMNPQPGYEHLDVRSDLPHVEHVHDISKSLPFEEGTFDEILSRSSLEHVSWRKVTNILRDWRRVLKPGGLLKLWLPDLEYLCSMYLNGKMDKHLDSTYVETAKKLLGGYTPAVWAAIKMFGGQDYSDNFHFAVYDFVTLSRILKMSGFVDVKRLPPYHGLNIIAHRSQDDSLTSLQIPSTNIVAEPTMHSASQTFVGSCLSHPRYDEEFSSTDLHLTWESPMLDMSGYATLSRNLVLGLDNLGVNVKAKPNWGACNIKKNSNDGSYEVVTFVNKSEVERIIHLSKRTDVEKGIYVCCHVPASFSRENFYKNFRKRSPDHKFYVGFTMFETDRIPESWVAACNGMDEIWVPTHFNLETFSRAGVDRYKIKVMPYGIDPSKYNPEEVESLQIEGKRGFNFLSVFEWTKRKGWDVLLKAYLQAFRSIDDVCLIIRAYYGKGGSVKNKIKNYIKSLGYELNKIPDIVVLDKKISDDRMPALYASADAFILPSRGEGWGIPYMEAMAMGLPTIGTRWSGNLEFMNDENSYLIDIEHLVDVDEEQVKDNPFYKGHKWAEPSVEHAGKLMRYVYENRKEAKEKGQKARKDILDNWTLPCAASQLVKRLQQIAGQLSEPLSVRNQSAIPPVLWSAPIFDPSGYADEARNFVLSLDKAGVAVRVNPIKWSNKTAELLPNVHKKLTQLTKTNISSRFVNVTHTFPPYFQKSPQAIVNIGKTIFETDRIPENWVSKCNEMDEIWVPTDFNIKTFTNAGVNPEKLYKIPEALDFSQYDPDVEPLPVEGRRNFNFLSVFDWTLRKGWDVLIRAFVEEFADEGGNDIALILKTWSSYGQSVNQIYQQVADYIKNELHRDPEKIPDITLLNVNIPVAQIPRLYKAVDAYVMPSRGEGWGRPYMEAMAMGLPTIGTRWSGNLEFMNDSNSYLIDCEVVDVPEDGWREIPAYKGHKWAEPSVNHLRQLMRYVYENQNEAQRLGEYARKDVINNYNWQAVSRIVIFRLEALNCLKAESGHKNVSGQNKTPAGSQTGKFQIIFEGSQFVYHSLALVNRELCIELAKREDVELSLIPYEPDQFDAKEDPERFSLIAERLNKPLSSPTEFHIRHQWPPNFTPPSEGHWIMIQPWEYGALPKDWVRPMETLVDELWVPSNYVRGIYIKSGISASKVFVIPNGVDYNKFHPRAKKYKLKTENRKKRFKFLFVGGTIWRKGIDILLEAYTAAFTNKDDVCLVIKDMGGQSFYKGQGALDQIEAIRKDKSAPEILYLIDDLNSAQITGLYTACDCLAHPYRGEGFGLPVVEAMACGLPVIVTSGGACDDFCTEENAYFIDGLVRPVNIPDCRLVSQGWVLEPDKRQLIERLRFVYENPEKAGKKGVAAAKLIREKVDWKKSADLIMNRLKALRCKPICRFQKQDLDERGGQ